jgi:hypothetical protein
MDFPVAQLAVSPVHDGSRASVKPIVINFNVVYRQFNSITGSFCARPQNVECVIINFHRRSALRHGIGHEWYVVIEVTIVNFCSGKSAGPELNRNVRRGSVVPCSGRSDRYSSIVDLYIKKENWSLAQVFIHTLFLHRYRTPKYPRSIRWQSEKLRNTNRHPTHNPSAWCFTVEFLHPTTKYRRSLHTGPYIFYGNVIAILNKDSTVIFPFRQSSGSWHFVSICFGCRCQVHQNLSVPNLRGGIIIERTGRFDDRLIHSSTFDMTPAGM